MFQQKYRQSHPENYLFSVSERLFSGPKYPKTFHLISETEAPVQPLNRLQCIPWLGHSENYLF